MMYSKKLMELFKHPKNVGEIKNADSVGTVGNIQCGDTMSIYLKIKDNKIKDIKFKTFGCAAAIATSSIITEMAKGKTLEEAERISPKEIVDKLGGIPPIKFHCSVLAHEAIREAIKNYRKKQEKKWG